MELKGHGRTDFRPVFDWVAKQPDAALLLYAPRRGGGHSGEGARVGGDVIEHRRGGGWGSLYFGGVSGGEQKRGSLTQKIEDDSGHRYGT